VSGEQSVVSDSQFFIHHSPLTIHDSSVQVCDARGDAMKNKSREQKK